MIVQTSSTHLHTLQRPKRNKIFFRFFRLLKLSHNFRPELHPLPDKPRGTSAHQNDRTDLPYTFTHLIGLKNAIKKFSIFSAPNSSWIRTLPRPDPRPKMTFFTYPSSHNSFWVKKIFWKNFQFFGPEVPIRSQAFTGPLEGPSRKPTPPSDPP